MAVRQRMEKSLQKSLENVKENIDIRSVYQSKEALRKMENSLLRNHLSLMMLAKIIDAGISNKKENKSESEMLSTLKVNLVVARNKFLVVENFSEFSK